MDDDDLLDIAATWSFWDRSPPPSIPRAVELPRLLSDRTALVIQGIRRCGKSTLLTQLIRPYRLDRRDCLFVNFEDSRLAGCLSFETLERLTRSFGELRGDAELSLRRIAAASGVAVETVSAYLQACAQAYLLFQCPWFAFSERKRSQRNRKYYPVDTALRRVAVTRTGGDAGKALECATFVELKKRYRDVLYWRGAGK